MSKRYKDINAIIDFITNGEDSELSGLSDEDDDDSEEDYVQNEGNQMLDDGITQETERPLSSDEDDDIPLIAFANNEPKKHVYRWRKNDIPMTSAKFTGSFSNPPVEEMTPLEYFYTFLPQKLVTDIFEQTNLYSVQRSCKSVNTNEDEMKTFIGIQMLMGIVKLPSYLDYWSGALRYPAIADCMPRNRFSNLKQFLHFVDNNGEHNDPGDKLIKVRPLLEAVRNACVLTEPEEYHSVDEQIIPSKTKFTKIRQYNPKKPRKWGFKNLVRAGSSGLMYDFYLYSGKQENGDTPYKDLQKSAQVVAKLCTDLPGNIGHKVFFDNWFTTLELMLYLKRRGILAVGTVRANRLQGCPLLSSKDLERQDRGSMDYRSDSNSAIIIIKWLDNSVVQLTSNYVGINPLGTIERWVKKDGERKEIPCPQIVKAYNKSMGGVDLADMLIALYRIEVKTKRW